MLLGSPLKGHLPVPLLLKGGKKSSGTSWLEHGILCSFIHGPKEAMDKQVLDTLKNATPALNPRLSGNAQEEQLTLSPGSWEGLPMEVVPMLRPEDEEG